MGSQPKRETIEDGNIIETSAYTKRELKNMCEYFQKEQEREKLFEEKNCRIIIDRDSNTSSENVTTQLLRPYSTASDTTIIGETYRKKEKDRRDCANMTQKNTAEEKTIYNYIRTTISSIRTAVGRNKRYLGYWNWVSGTIGAVCIVHSFFYLQNISKSSNGKESWEYSRKNQKEPYIEDIIEKNNKENKNKSISHKIVTKKNEVMADKKKGKPHTKVKEIKRKREKVIGLKEAVELLATGRYKKAYNRYKKIAEQHKEKKVYNVVSRVLRKEINKNSHQFGEEMCKKGEM